MADAAYATVQDMVDRFGTTELIRLTTPADQDMETIQSDAVQRALAEATALADTYLRKRYQVPVAAPLPELRRAVCILARYDLSLGENREPSEQTRLSRKEVLEWLSDIADGKIVLDLDEVPPSDESHALMQDRSAAFGREGW